MLESLKTMLRLPEDDQKPVVSGLYHKALRYINRPAALQEDELPSEEPEKPSGSTTDGISEEEKREIIDEIDALIAQKKTRITPELLVYKPEHLGFFLPLLINLLATGVVLVAFLFLPFLFERGFFEHSEKSNQTILSAESDIVEKFKQESAAKISEKEAELSNIQGRMGQLQKEKEALDANFSDQVRKKEEELKKSLAHTLEQEKQKLLNKGISQEKMDAELQKLELQLRKTNTQTLDSYKGEMQAELKEKEQLISRLGEQLNSGQQALSKIQEQYQSQIQTRESAIKSREEEIKKREESLQTDYQSRKQQLENALGDVSGQFSRLQEAQQQEQFVHNQLLLYYNQLDTSLKKQDYPKAQEQINELEKFINKKENAGLTLIRERKPVELFLINSLQDYIALKQTGGKKKKDDSSEMVESIIATVKEAQQAYKRNDKQQAYQLYLTALEKIPEIKTSYNALQSENDTLHKNELENLASQITELKKKQTELEDQALAMTNELSRLKSVSDADVPGEQKRKQLAERLGNMKQQYLHYLEKNKPGADNSLTDEYRLMQSKLTLKKILTSQDISRQYPDLYRDMENYFNNLDETRTNWRSVTKGLLRVLDYLNGEITANSFKSLWPVYRLESQQKLLQSYLANLQSAFMLIHNEQVKKVDELESGFFGSLNAKKTNPVLSESEIYNLVMAKLVVKKILAAEPYASGYPELDQNLDKYTALLEQQQTSWQNCFQELVYLTSRLNEGFKPGELTSHWMAFLLPEYKELLLDFINTMQALL